MSPFVLIILLAYVCGPLGGDAGYIPFQTEAACSAAVAELEMAYSVPHPTYRVTLKARRYTIDEIDRMRNAIYVFVSDAAVVEDRLRTYMTNGTDPDELQVKADSYTECMRSYRLLRRAIDLVDDANRLARGESLRWRTDRRWPA